MQIEQVRDAATPADMRAEIYRLRREVPLVRSVMYIADYNGLSAEDRYTMLAYHALKESAEARELLLEQLNITPHPFLLRHNAESNGAKHPTRTPG